MYLFVLESYSCWWISLFCCNSERDRECEGTSWEAAPAIWWHVFNQLTGSITMPCFVLPPTTSPVSRPTHLNSTSHRYLFQSPRFFSGKKETLSDFVLLGLHSSDMGSRIQRFWLRLAQGVPWNDTFWGRSLLGSSFNLLMLLIESFRYQSIFTFGQIPKSCQFCTFYFWVSNFSWWND